MFIKYFVFGPAFWDFGLIHRVLTESKLVDPHAICGDLCGHVIVHVGEAIHLFE
ncbi:MAG: hypothetical protein P8165_06110 [Deltaproteobacteria bacterium]|jgi:hypothetical protein